jgi:hypothetical protein
MLALTKPAQPASVLGALTRTLITLVGLFACTGIALGQSFPAAENNLDLHIGSGFTTGSSDYATDHISGYSITGGIKLRDHVAEESEFRRLTDPKSSFSETSLITGVSCSVKYWGISPYVKGLAGIGFLSNPSARLAVLSAGGGLDFTVKPLVHLRADYEYQSWPGELGFQHGLVAKMITLGVVYHVHPLDRPRVY